MNLEPTDDAAPMSEIRPPARDRRARPNDDLVREHWRAVIARIAKQLDEFKARIDIESESLYTKLSLEIATLQTDLKNLEAEVAAAAPDAFAKRVSTEIEDLRAKGDAAYDLLQASLSAQLDPTDVEIRRLEAILLDANEETRAKIKGRIEQMRAAQSAVHTQTPTANGSEPSSGAVH
jgi:hypothetical protein